MAPQNRSIQSYFSTSSSAPASSSPRQGDGFTEAEINQALSTSPPGPWSPATDYQKHDIGDMIPGKDYVTFTGRIANLSTFALKKLPRTAKGCMKIVIVDHSGTITVRLCYSKYEYKLRLGQRVTVWTTHISSGKRHNFSTALPTIHIDLFPERQQYCHFSTHDENDEPTQCRAPLGFETALNIQSLMTLKAYVDGGWEVDDAKIMVVVKSIGARKKVTRKDGNMVEVTNVVVFDNSEEASLSLWDMTASSGAAWEPSKSVLLITSPTYNTVQKNSLSLSAVSLVEVDPDVPDATWLRRYAERLAKKRHVNQAFPPGVRAEELKNAPIRALYTLADIDEQVREAPKDTFYGYLSMVILELKFVTLHCKKMLLCAECCGVPIYDNSERASCKQCDRPVSLRLNPQAVGMLVDETGCIGAGNLVFSDDAWKQLLGCEVNEVIKSGTEVKSLERQLLFKRIVIMFYWSEEVGKISVVEVQGRDLEER
ncbi:hypothetical protein BDV97DRAFT_154736 [Delphinella strobiligena]|nr:hypothetical protein BDV97DRAFT_154736 [Delphinella strobiligena]